MTKTGQATASVLWYRPKNSYPLKNTKIYSIESDFIVAWKQRSSDESTNQAHRIIWKLHVVARQVRNFCVLRCAAATPWERNWAYIFSTFLIFAIITATSALLPQHWYRFIAWGSLSKHKLLQTTHAAGKLPELRGTNLQWTGRKWWWGATLWKTLNSKRVYLSCLHFFCSSSEGNIWVVGCCAISLFWFDLWYQWHFLKMQK